MVGEPLWPLQPTHQCRAEGAVGDPGACPHRGLHARTRGAALGTPGGADRSAPGPRFLRLGWLIGHRDRPQDECPLLAQPGPGEEVPLREPGGSYHGETVGALAVTDVALFRDAYAPLLRAGSTVPCPDTRLAEPGET